MCSPPSPRPSPPGEGEVVGRAFLVCERRDSSSEVGGGDEIGLIGLMGLMGESLVGASTGVSFLVRASSRRLLLAGGPRDPNHASLVTHHVPITFVRRTISCTIRGP